MLAARAVQSQMRAFFSPSFFPILSFSFIIITTISRRIFYQENIQIYSSYFDIEKVFLG